MREADVCIEAESARIYVCMFPCLSHARVRNGSEMLRREAESKSKEKGDSDDGSIGFFGVAG